MTVEHENEIVTVLNRIAKSLEAIAALHGESAAPTAPVRFDTSATESVNSPPSVAKKASGIRTA